MDLRMGKSTTTRTTPRRAAMASPVRRDLLLVVTVFAAAIGWGCGDVPGGEFALSIDECEEIGGTPLFDPEDQRPLQLSCPQGLVYMGQFDEDFYGTEGGVCCGGLTSPDEAAAEASDDSAAEASGDRAHEL